MFKSFFAIEWHRRMQKKEIVIFLIVLLGLIGFTHREKAKYLKAQEDIQIFQEMENIKVSEYRLYRQYGSFGFNLLFIPSPYSILHNDYVFEGLQANVNVAEKLNIYKQIKGKKFFSARTGFMSFSGVLLLLGAGVALVYGFDTARSRDKLGILFISSNFKKSVWAFIWVRLILLNAVTLILVLLTLSTLLFNTLNLFDSPIIIFLKALLVVVNFFFALGGLVGFIKDSLRVLVLVSVYFLSVVVFPYLAEIKSEIDAADMEPLMKFELDSMKIIRGVDRQLIEKHGSLKSNESAPVEVIKDMQKAVANEHGRLKDRETQMRQEVTAKINKNHTISSLFPVLFYLSTTKEISSHCGLNLVDFYLFCQKRKGEFIDFYVDRRFLTEKSPDRIGPVENFIKGNENLFYAKHRLPSGYGFGFMVSLVWVAGFLLLLKNTYVRSLTSRSVPSENEDILNLKKNKIRSFPTNSPEQISKIIAGIQFNNPRTIQVPGWDSLPGSIKVECFFSFFNLALPEKLKPVAKQFCNRNLAPDYKALIIMEIIRHFNADVFIFNDFLNGLTDEFLGYFKDVLETLKKGRHIVYFSSSITTASRIGDKLARYHDDPSF